MKETIKKVEEILDSLRGKYLCKVHPTDKKSVVIYNIALKSFCKLCQTLKCSGFYNEEQKFGVASNFGRYE